MNTFLSILGFLSILSLTWLGGRSLDSTARTAIRGWGTVLAVGYLVTALLTSWEWATLGLLGLAILIIVSSLL
jgi:prepilin signal peptidase PulO-like enzyme (type II secretory pathway)